MYAICACPRTALCDDCYRRALFEMPGHAAARGIRWAESVARARPDLIGEPWPELTPGSRAHAIALAKVDDLGDDPRVREHLMARLHLEAARRWTQLRSSSATAARRSR